MDFNTIITAIGSLGFPIVACILMGYMLLKFTDNYRQDIKSIQIQRERRELLKRGKSQGLYR